MPTTMFPVDSNPIWKLWRLFAPDGTITGRYIWTERLTKWFPGWPLYQKNFRLHFLLLTHLPYIGTSLIQFEIVTWKLLINSISLNKIISLRNQSRFILSFSFHNTKLNWSGSKCYWKELKKSYLVHLFWTFIQKFQTSVIFQTFIERNFQLNIEKSHVAKCFSWCVNRKNVHFEVITLVSKHLHQSSKTFFFLFQFSFLSLRVCYR